MARKASSDAALEELRAFGLGYPGAHTKSPWPGHLDLAVKDKTFAYLAPPGEPFSIGCKLPRSSSVALLLPFATPTAYGLGKRGWVTATPPPGTPLPVEMFKAWIDESYRAQAPKKLVKQLATPRLGGAPSAAKPVKPSSKRAPKRAPKRAAKRPARARR